LAKKYIEGETKAQRKARKAKEKSAKTFVEDAQDMADAFNEVFADELAAMSKEKYNVLCLKHGNKYSPEYVNNLKKMVDRHLTLPYNFYCLTENPLGLDDGIEVIKLPDHLQGWWCKPYMYSNSLPIEGTILYMDLDVVIGSNIDKLFTFHPGEWCVIRDFTRAMQPTWQKYNSSVIRFKKGQLNNVWTEFNKDPQKIIGSHFGDQDWLWTAAKGTAKLWPDSWIQSYKWEIRKDRQLTAGEKGKRKFMNKENPTPPEECCIAVFHGDPNPHNCTDPWVVNNWK